MLKEFQHIAEDQQIRGSTIYCITDVIMNATGWTTESTFSKVYGKQTYNSGQFSLDQWDM